MPPGEGPTGPQVNPELEQLAQEVAAQTPDEPVERAFVAQTPDGEILDRNLAALESGKLPQAGSGLTEAVVYEATLAELAEDADGDLGTEGANVRKKLKGPDAGLDL